MIDFYYRDLRRRLERMEAFFFPKPKVVVYLDVVDENDEPYMIIGPDIDWTRGDDDPPGIPPELLHTEHAEAWTYHKHTSSPVERAPPQGRPRTV